MKAPAAFAIPGDIRTLTGGYIYERRLLEGLRALGHDMSHLELSASFPDPDPRAMADAVAQMEHVAPTRPLIVDGLVFGAIDPAGLARVRAPVIAMIHHPLALESGLDPARARHLFETERDNLRLAAHVLVPSAHTRDTLVTRYGADAGSITVARPGVDRPDVTPAPADPPLILSVGILHPRKGHDVLLCALAQITDLDWQAVIVGKEHEPGELARLRALVDELGISVRVRFAGRIEQDELDRLYASATVFALATRYEGYGIVLDEALIHGLPIVSCRTGAVPDTVPADAGILVPPDDPDAFAGALRVVMTDPAARAAFAAASAHAGRERPGWQDTASIASGVIELLARRVR